MLSEAWSKKWLPEPKITQLFHIVEPWADTLVTLTGGVASFQYSAVLTWIGNDLFNHAALANFPNIVRPNKVWYQNETFCSIEMLRKVCTHSYSCSFHNRKLSGKSLFGPVGTMQYACLPSWGLSLTVVIVCWSSSAESPLIHSPLPSGINLLD